MFEQIESSHILKCNDYIEICYCLACKEEIDEDSICQHLLGFEHEDNKRALFKLSVPDKYCDSRDVKYLDIVNNCVFDVSWEIGSEASYVCKRDNHLICLICEEEVHNFNTISKVNSSLKCHLNSKSHLKNITYNIPWVYHPNGSYNFISFYKSTVFCSFCQSYLESSSDTVLQTAADHLQIEKEHSDKNNITKEAFSSEEDEENSEFEEEEEATLFPASDRAEYVTNALNNINQSYELDYDGKDLFVSSNDKNQTLLLQDGVTETNIELFDDFLCKTGKVNAVNENQKAHELANEVQDGESSITIAENPNKIIDEKYVLSSDHQALKKLINKSLIFKVNKAYIDKKDDEFYCTICQLSFEYSENGKYLRKHLYSKEHNAVLEKHALNYVTMVQHKKKIELPEQNENVNKFLAVLNDISRDNMFMSHVKYMTNNGKHFICLICDSNIPFTSCGKYVESHILSSKHLKKVFNVNNCAIIEQTESNFNKEPENMFLEVIENLSKEASTYCNLSKSCLYDEVPSNNCIEHLSKELTSTLPAENNDQDSVLSCKEDIDQGFNNESITGISHENVGSSVIDRRQSQAWKKMQKKVWELGINSHFIGLKERNFFCELCQEAVKFSQTGYRLVKHCTSLSHNKILIRKATDYVLSIGGESLITNSNESLHQFQNILSMFAKQFQNNEVIQSHLLFICVEEDKFFCMLCRKVIKTSVASVKGHLFTNLHKKNVVDLNCNKNFLKKGLSHEVENGKVGLDSKSLLVGETGNNFTFRNEKMHSCEEKISVIKNFDQVEASSSDKTSRNSESFISKDELPCSECGELITIWNKETEFSMQLHLQKHKALLKMDDPHKQEFQENTDYVCPVCQVPITVFNKDIILSVERHFEEFHQTELQSKTCLLNTERNSIISHTQIFYNLPDHLKDHVNFINMKGENFFCKLCNCQLPPISDLSSGLEMLKNHFTDFFHKTQFKLSLQSDSEDEFGEEIDDSCSLEDFSSNVTGVDRNPKINHIEKKYFESKPERVTINISKNKVIPFECFALQSGIWDFEKFTTTLVNHFARNNLALKLNSIFFSGKGDQFYCVICQEYIGYDESGNGLKKHSNMQRHNDFIEISTDKFLSSLTESYSVLNKISKKLSSCIPMRSHVKFLTKIEFSMVCLLCNKSISYNITQNDAKEHCCSEIHLQKTLELVQRSIGVPISTTKLEFNITQSSTSKPRKAVSSFEVHFILWLLSTKHTIVKENITIIGEKSGYFHCKECNEKLICNVKGKKLIQHLLKKHCNQPNNVKLSSVPNYFVGPLVDLERPSLSPVSVLGSGSDTNPSQSVLDVTFRKTNVSERNICEEVSEKIVKESCNSSEKSNKKGPGKSRKRSKLLSLLEKQGFKIL